MRNELLDLIRAIVNTRFAVENVANSAIHDLRSGNPSSYRGHKWDRQHYEVMERVHQGVEAAWHYAKWLQFPEMESRLDDGFAALSQSMGAQSEMDKLRLTNTGSFVASLAAIEGTVVESDSDGKDPIMAKETVASLTDKYADMFERFEERSETVDEHIENLNNQIATTRLLGWKSESMKWRSLETSAESVAVRCPRKSARQLESGCKWVEPRSWAWTVSSSCTR